MNFTEYLNLIYSKLDCTQTELSNASKLSAPVISRYLSGVREPAADSELLKALTMGIHQLALARNFTTEEFDSDHLLHEFNRLLQQKKVLYQSFVRNFNHFIDHLHLSMKELANALNYDVSYLYRIKAGERHPVDLNNFCLLFAEYILANRNSEEDLLIISHLLDCTVEVLRNPDSFKEKILLFLTEPEPFEDEPPQMDNFLQKMEEFNLDEYIKVIHFDELKVPSLPFSLPSSKYYYGVEEMRNAELDFLKATVLGKSKESVTMCSYMPMQEMVQDMDFSKKWMFGIAMMIKKGLHLNVIHNLNRPMDEIMLGLEAWIPIYMTGQVSPFHIPDYNSDIFHQINYCSGNAALMGECIDGFYNDGRYYVTNNKSELAYFRQKTTALLKKAEPLMDIYTEENREDFQAFLEKSLRQEGDRKIIDAALPDFTLPTELLEKHLDKLEEKDRAEIFSYLEHAKEYARQILKTNRLTYNICILSEAQYHKNPVTLHFPAIFCKHTITLSYDEYLAHLAATQEYAEKNCNFILNPVDIIPFHNIKICIISGKYFIISKAKSPSIHFVIYHKKMLDGMENFYLAYQE